MLDLSKYQTVWVNIADINIENTAFMFRKDLKADDLAQSLKAEGQKFPIVLWKRASGGLQLISGFRRVSAAKLLGWDKVLAVVIPETDLPEDEAIRLNFLENIERKSLNNLDIMFACQKLSHHGKSNVEIGKLIGKSENQVRRYLKVAEAPADVQQKVETGEATIKDVASADHLAPGGEATAQNKNCYVKSINKGFDAVLHYRANRDDPAVLDTFINALKKALKDALKALKKVTKSKANTDEAKARKQGLEILKSMFAEAPPGPSSSGAVTGDPFSPKEGGGEGAKEDQSSAESKQWTPVGCTGGTELPADSEGLKKAIIDQQKMALENIKQMAQNPQTKPMVEAMAKADNCGSVEEFIAKMEKQTEEAIKKIQDSNEAKKE